MQLFGRAFDEVTILRAAKAMGRVLPDMPEPTGI